MATLDALLDDFPLQSTLRIPPLLDPLPDYATKSDLPSPLEPNAQLHTDIDIDTAKLSGRRRALAEAKQLGESAGSSDLRPIQRGPRRRQKLQEYERIADFVQLPEPKTVPKKEKPRPFKPVSVLNELHEPPPSAALFPPITPKEALHEQSQSLFSQSIEGRSPAEEEVLAASKKVRSKGDAQSQKRTSQRPRTKWTTQETEQLQKGVQLYGVGKWKKILNHPGFSFQPGRTPVDLKDHHRTKLKSQAFKKALSQANHDGGQLSPMDARLSSESRLATASDPNIYLESASSTLNNRKGTWTDIEDEDLEKGYKKYGFSWTRIAKDPDLNLAHRTGPQVRDRFRTKFPALYGEDPRQYSRHGKDVKEIKEIDTPLQADLGNVKEATVDEISGPAKRTERPRDISSRSSSDSDHIGNAADSHPAISPLRPLASASSAYNILDLLNSDGDDDRPSSALRMDPWDSNVTLPPLLWEEMATRPMFDLE